MTTNHINMTKVSSYACKQTYGLSENIVNGIKTQALVFPIHETPWTGLEEPIREWSATVACSACDVTADSAAKAKKKLNGFLPYQIQELPCEDIICFTAEGYCTIYTRINRIKKPL